MDAIIIGSGLGGLITAAKLAKENKKVVVIEQHSIVGGCATNFKRKDFILEVSLHEMDGLDNLDVKKSIFTDLDVFKHIQFLRVPEFYRVKRGNLDICIPDNKVEAIELLIKKFPHESKGIKTFFRRITAIRKEVTQLPRTALAKSWKYPLFPFLYPGLVRSSHLSVGHYLDSIINDDDLKLVLMGNLLYYHDDPYTMSLIYFSSAQAGYYEGGWYVQGGSQKFSDYLASIVTSHGGKVITNSLVTDILVSQGKAIGVKYKKRNNPASPSTEIYANCIVSNSAVPNTIKMLPEGYQNNWQKKCSSLEVSCSLLTVYLRFNQDISNLGSHYYSTCVFPDDVRSIRDMYRNNKDNFDKRAFIFVDYSQIDSQLAPQGKSVGAICTTDYSSDWNPSDREGYKKQKQIAAEKLINRLEVILPGIRQYIEGYDVGTSHTISRYTLAPGGSVYGYAQTPSQAGLHRLNHKCPVNQLYCASAWVIPGGGFTGSIISGWICANKILKGSASSPQG